MTQEKRVENALEAYLENPFWKDFYEQAPSDNCKKFIALNYAWSKYHENEDLDAMHELEKALTKEDYEYRLAHAGSGYERNAIWQKMKEYKIS